MHYLYRYVCILNVFLYICIWTIVCNKEFITIIILRDTKTIMIIILYPYGNSLSMSTGFQITNFKCQQFSIGLISVLLDVFNLVVKE